MKISLIICKIWYPIFRMAKLCIVLFINYVTGIAVKYFAVNFPISEHSGTVSLPGTIP